MHYLNYIFCNRKDCRKYRICGVSVAAAEMWKKDSKRTADDSPIQSESINCERYEMGRETLAGSTTVYPRQHRRRPKEPGPYLGIHEMPAR